jgi:hypothetical protein
MKSTVVKKSVARTKRMINDPANKITVKTMKARPLKVHELEYFCKVTFYLHYI